MPRAFPSALLVLLLPLVGSGAPVDFEGAHPADAPAEAALCDITIRGIHGGRSGTITFDFNVSKVRNQRGWWTQLGVGSNDRLPVEAGRRFSQVFPRDFDCNARRKYRLYMEARVDGDRYEYVHYYPSVDGFTRETAIDLGDISRFFDAIEPGPPPVEPAPTDAPDTPTPSPPALDGEWIRRDSNNDRNDGMRIVVQGDRAVLTSVPSSSTRFWVEGEVLWQGIEPDGSLEVLGSNDAYYDAQLIRRGNDRVDIDIAANGAGNDQTWERAQAVEEPSDSPEACWSDVAEIAGDLRSDDIWVRYTEATPPGLGTALLGARDRGATIQTVAVGPGGRWVMVAGNVPCFSATVPDGLRGAVEGFIAQGREIDVVEFGPAGRWLVVAEDRVRRSTNVSEETRDRIRSVIEDGTRLTSFAFPPNPDRDYIFTARDRAFHGSTQLVGLVRALDAARVGRRDVQHVDVGRDGRWVLLADNWFASDGLPAGLLRQMDRYRTDSLRHLDHVVLFGEGDEAGWIIVSNERQPPTVMGDAPGYVETSFPGDSTIYQKMKQYGIVGLSIAVVEDNQVSWARGYGLRDIGEPESYIYPNTVFDAASISKPLVGAAMLRLIDESDDLSLTETGVLRDLEGPFWPAGDAFEALRPDDISIAHLMNHCAGLDHANMSSGAESFAVGATLPTYAQMFLGTGPADANRRIVPIDGVEVGDMADYSGANSLLLQALIEHHAEGSFDDHMDRLLDDLNMNSSTYRRDVLDGPLRHRFAYGHGQNAAGDLFRSDARIYPNQAAAGLRTTAVDLAKFIIMLNQEGQFLGRSVLSEERFEQFIGWDWDTGSGVSRGSCDDASGMRLHIRNPNPDPTRMNEVVYHGGVHNNYRTFMYALPNQDEGVAVLITGEWDDLPSGTSPLERFADELRGVMQGSIPYGWPTLR